jgi:hypothetical protein
MVSYFKLLLSAIPSNILDDSFSPALTFRVTE